MDDPIGPGGLPPLPALPDLTASAVGYNQPAINIGVAQPQDSPTARYEVAASVGVPGATVVPPTSQHTIALGPEFGALRVDASAASALSGRSPYEFVAAPLQPGITASATPIGSELNLLTTGPEPLHQRHRFEIDSEMFPGLKVGFASAPRSVNKEDDVPEVAPALPTDDSWIVATRGFPRPRTPAPEHVGNIYDSRKAMPVHRLVARNVRSRSSGGKSPMNICPKCGTECLGTFCGNCGSAWCWRCDSELEGGECRNPQCEGYKPERCGRCGLEDCECEALHGQTGE